MLDKNHVNHFSHINIFIISITSSFVIFSTISSQILLIISISQLLFLTLIGELELICTSEKFCFDA
ncbi:hypothetical protein GW891_04735 [bacterium]|nr:hypothetical protein [bacterium]